MPKHRIKSYILSFIILCFFAIPLFSYNTVTFHDQRDKIEITTLYGKITVEEPVLLELLRSPMMERLKHIHQYGPFYYMVRPVDYSRYDHTIGVFTLLRNAGAPLEEQISGLLHDISHTVFSHCGSLVFSATILDAESQQDDDHVAFLKATGIDDILHKHGFNSEQVHHKNKHFTALERDLPNLCADRIEYNLNGALQENLLTKQQITSILAHLKFEHGFWFFTDPYSAKKFASISLWKTEHTWGSAENVMVCLWTSQALRQAISLQLIDIDTILYGTDDEVWQLLHFSNDPLIKQFLHQGHNYSRQFTVSQGTVDTTLYAKFRGVDPLVETPEGLIHLTSLDPEFKLEYERVKRVMKNGWPIRFTS